MQEILNRLLDIHSNLNEVESLLEEVHPWKPGAGWPNNGVYEDLYSTQDWLDTLIKTIEGLSDDGGSTERW